MRKLLLSLCLFLSVTIHAQLQQDLALKYLVQQPKVTTTKPPVIILLHGYGSNEADLFELKDIFPKNFLVVSARAPYPVGATGFQWFEIGAVSNDKTKQVEDSRDLVMKFISQVTGKYHTGDVYVSGFSQGAMMSYEVGLLHPDKIKGIGVLSGKLFPSLKKEIKNSAALKQLKIFISHGTTDDRISFTEGKAASDYLVSIGLKPEFHQYAGMGHSISKDVLKDLLQWLGR